MKKAFTMIELIFVIVILGILAAVAIPRLSATRDDALTTVYLQNLRSSITDIGSYYSAKGEFSSIREMTYIKNYSDYDTSYKNGGVVYFVTQLSGSTKENCVKFEFFPDGNLTLSNVSGARGRMCKFLQDNASYKTLKVTHNIGGNRIAF